MPLVSSAAYEFLAATHFNNLPVWKHHIQNRKTCIVGNRRNSPTVRKRRRTVRSIHRELGAIIFRRSFRMSLLHFFNLYSKIRPELLIVLSKDNNQTNQTKKNHKIHPVSGCIPLTVRLACAIRFWAGGDPYDICVMFGVSYTEIFKSVNSCLHAIENTKDLQIKFPTAHQEQQKRLPKRSKQNQRLTLTAVWDVWMDCLFGCIVLQKMNVIMYKWVRLNFFVEESINLVWICKQFVMHNEDSWIFKYFMEQHHQTFWPLRLHQSVLKCPDLVSLHLACDFSATMHTSTGHSWQHTIPKHRSWPSKRCVQLLPFTSTYQHWMCIWNASFWFLKEESTSQILNQEDCMHDKSTLHAAQFFDRLWLQ